MHKQYLNLPFLVLISSPSYVAAGASFDAAKVIARKNDVSSLRTAASLARISGEVTLAQSLALRCAKDLAAALDWVGAQEVLSSQESLLVSGSNIMKKHFSYTNNDSSKHCFTLKGHMPKTQRNSTNNGIIKA